MSRTERKLRQALAEIEALRADRPKMQETITLLTNQNFEMHSALREAEIVLTTVQTVEAQTTPPREWFTRLEFALVLTRAALGMQPSPPQALWCSLPIPPLPCTIPDGPPLKLFAGLTDGHTDECSGWLAGGACDCGRTKST